MRTAAPIITTGIQGIIVMSPSDNNDVDDAMMSTTEATSPRTT